MTIAPKLEDHGLDPMMEAFGALGDATLRDGCGDFQIRIGKDGTWYYRDSPIRRPALVKLFSTVLRREADGTYWLVTPAERGRIEVEDTPFLAVELDAAGMDREQILTFRTNLDDTVEAGENHPLRVDFAPGSHEPRPYILVRDGLEARLTRSVFYQLVALGCLDDRALEDPGEGRGTGEGLDFGVWSNGKFFSLGTLAETV